ncbi:hypothetical protein BVF97_30800 [Bacillus thuringiensis]|uniref:Uncharacterized protein n=1 Tax=Bacillus thuringiensis TaxID=1428 RepID=A0ABD6R0T3_BACTU|nr:hypothetical protein BVF97_30800 [Bacillus thuringiensis]
MPYKSKIIFIPFGTMCSTQKPPYQKVYLLENTNMPLKLKILMFVTMSENIYKLLAHNFPERGKVIPNMKIYKVRQILKNI